MMELIRSAYDWWIAKLGQSAIPSRPNLRCASACTRRVMRWSAIGSDTRNKESCCGRTIPETSQQYATGMDDDMSVRLQTETIISMAGFAVTSEYPEYRTDALRIGGDVQSKLVNAAIIHRIDPAMGSTDEIMDSLWSGRGSRQGTTSP